MEGTITQQTKLIDFLQSQAHGGSKKKKVQTSNTNITASSYLHPFMFNSGSFLFQLSRGHILIFYNVIY